MKIFRFAFVLFCPLFSGCAYYQPMGISSTSVGSQYERPSGMAEGRSARWSFFPCYAVCAVGDDSLMAAVKDALDGRAADTLANIYVERKTVAFPFALLPLITRTEVVVMGTLVKYNTKEFPPDKDFVYSGNSGEMWSQMVSFGKAERARYFKGLSDRNRSMLVDYALFREKERLIETGSKDSEVFSLLLLREPITVTPKSAYRNESAINLNDCNTYECIITLGPEKQAAALGILNSTDNKSVRATFLNSAQKRIRACYPDKTPAIVTSPETQLIYNESALLETLCKTGELNR